MVKHAYIFELFNAWLVNYILIFIGQKIAMDPYLTFVTGQLKLPSAETRIIAVGISN